MRHFLPITCILAGTLLAGGCATKKYVRNTTAPIQAKVDQIGEQTTKQGQAIEETKTQVKQVDDRAQSGISAAQERAATADNHAQSAMTKATQVEQQASKNSQDVATLRQVVTNFDDYKLADDQTIPFGFDKYSLTPETKQQLDELANKASQMKRYIIAVEGFTDRIGSEQYNETLSRKRANSVVEYLVAEHNIPIYRIHMIGLGEQKLADTGRDRAARAKNRRVEIRVFSADQATATLSQLNP